MVVSAKWNIWSMQNPWLSRMTNANEVTGEYQYWTKLLDHPCKIVIVVSSGSGKTNALLNLINHHNIDKFFFYVKYKYKSSYQYLINKYQEIGQINLITLTLSMNTQMMWMMSAKVLEITIPKRKEQFW